MVAAVYGFLKNSSLLVLQVFIVTFSVYLYPQLKKNTRKLRKEKFDPVFFLIDHICG